MGNDSQPRVAGAGVHGQRRLARAEATTYGAPTACHGPRHLLTTIPGDRASSHCHFSEEQPEAWGH